MGILKLDASLILKDYSFNLYFHKPYAMPYVIKDVVSLELDTMIEILVSKKQNDIANPIVVVPKKNERIRICVNLKKNT